MSEKMNTRRMIKTLADKIPFEGLNLNWKEVDNIIELLRKSEEERLVYGRMVRDIFNLLDKEGCTMILWEKELSWGENWAKITDRKTTAEFKILDRRKIIPSLEQVKYVIRVIKEATKNKERGKGNVG